MCLNLYNYLSKASRYSYGLTHLKTRVITDKKYIINSQNPKRNELKHNTKENHEITNWKTKKNKKSYKNNQNIRFKMALKHTYNVYFNVYLSMFTLNENG